MRPLEGVREWRERRMLSQQELADRAGVSLFTIQRIERGEGSVRPKTGRAVAKALGVAVEDLLPKVPAPPDLQRSFNGLLEEERHSSAMSETAKAIFELLERWYDRRLAEVEDPTSPHFRDATTAALWVATTRVDANDLIEWLADWLQEHREQIDSWDDLLYLFGAALSLDKPADLGERRLQEMADRPDEVAARRLQRATAEAGESRERLEEWRRAASG